MRYKVGDKVRVKSLEWFFNNYEVYGKIIMGNHIFTASMAKYCGGIVTIDYVCNDSYQIKEDDEPNGWTDDMFEGLAEEGMYDDEFKNAINVAYNACLDEYNEVPNKLKIDQVFISDKNYQDKVELCLGDDYEIVVENNKTFIQKKSQKYPKSYYECCKVLDTECTAILRPGYQYRKIENFQKLLICRDTYWKIAGEEMGIGKPWEPNYISLINNEYFTIHTFNNEIIKSGISHRNAILAFPTEEMRDAFYESFKDLIEKCKELL